MTFAQAEFSATSSGGPRAYANNRRAMKIALRASYPFFFAATLVRRVNPFASRSMSRTSVFAETRARAAAIVPFIFMG